jgi:hypothetical protein
VETRSLDRPLTTFSAVGELPSYYTAIASTLGSEERACAPCGEKTKAKTKQKVKSKKAKGKSEVSACGGWFRIGEADETSAVRRAFTPGEIRARRTPWFCLSS